MTDAGLEVISQPGVTLYLNARHFPVLIVNWFGEANVEVINRYCDWIERMAIRAKKQGTKVVILGDSTTIVRPSPQVRKAMAKGLEELTERNGDGFLGGSTIIGQPLMRAVVTMILALSRRKIDFRPVKDAQQGFERTRRLLDEAGIPWPSTLDPETYERPPPPVVMPKS